MRKLTLKRPRPFKNLNAPYRMVFINEDSLEEVASFHLTKKSVYTLFSTLFVVTILVTVCILLFTPLKYYIPGYGSNSDRVEVMRLEQKVDSLASLVQAGEQKAEQIAAVIGAKDEHSRDTSLLSPELINSSQESIMPASADIKNQAIEAVKKDKAHAKGKR